MPSSGCAWRRRGGFCRSRVCRSNGSRSVAASVRKKPCAAAFCACLRPHRRTIAPASALERRRTGQLGGRSRKIRARRPSGPWLDGLCGDSYAFPAEHIISGSFAVSIEFLLTSLIVVASPGTGVRSTLAAGLSRGTRASVVAAFACTLGIIPHMAAAVTGLGALLHPSAVAFQTLKYAGVAYLLYMAWKTLGEHGALKIEKEIAPRSGRQVSVRQVSVRQVSVREVIVSGVLINILNPKLSIFFFAFLPQFLTPDEPN